MNLKLWFPDFQLSYIIIISLILNIKICGKRDFKLSFYFCVSYRGLKIISHQLAICFNKQFYWNSHTHLLTYILSVNTIHGQRWVTAMVTTWLTKKNVFTIWSFTENVCVPHFLFLQILSQINVGHKIIFK
jgi:hypothetical protein